MRKIGLIIKREYMAGVKTKAFIFTTIGFPLIGVGFFVLILFLANRQPTKTFRMAIVDDAGGLATSISQGLDAKLPNGQPEFAIVQSIEQPVSPDTVQDDLRSRINAGGLDGYLLAPRNLSQPVELHTRNTGDFALLGPLTAAVNRAVILKRLAARGIHVQDASAITGAPDLKLIKVGKTGEAVERGQSIGIAIALVILLYVSLVAYGVITMRSVLEEKTTRTMEVLVSSVRPFELLAGKVLGVAGMAFTQLTIWAVTGVLLISYGALAAKASGATSPTSDVHVPASLLVYVVIFFVGGYCLYSSLFAAIGAACSSEQDAQHLQWVAMAPLVFTMFVYSLILTDPTSTLAIVLSIIPFFAPVLMPLRISLQMPAFWQIGLSIVLLFVTAVGVIYASGKIYRIGVLMYGKRPTIPELARWLRYS
jgi:ABC-2 type transport system permease protein